MSDSDNDAGPPASLSPAQRVFCLPKTLLPVKGDANHVAVTLPHPRAGTPSLFLRPEGQDHYYELVKFAEKTRSWFLGNTVESDGELYIVTPVNPIYFAIFYLQKSDKFRPLADVFEDRDFPQAHTVRNWCEKRIGRVADSKDIAGGTLRVYRLNAEKTVAWLRGRVRRVVGALRTHRVCSSSSADLVRSNKDAATDDDTGEYTQCAFSIVADYVPQSVSAQLKTALGLDVATERKAKPQSEELPPAKRQKAMSVKPAEDYTNGGTNKKTPAQKTPKAPAAKKFDTTGMRTISSFFAKK